MTETNTIDTLDINFVQDEPSDYERANARKEYAALGWKIANGNKLDRADNERLQECVALLEISKSRFAEDQDVFAQYILGERTNFRPVHPPELIAQLQAAGDKLREIEESIRQQPYAQREFDQLAGKMQAINADAEERAKAFRQLKSDRRDILGDLEDAMQAARIASYQSIQT